MLGLSPLSSLPIVSNPYIFALTATGVSGVGNAGSVGFNKSLSILGVSSTGYANSIVEAASIAGVSSIGVTSNLTISVYDLSIITGVFGTGVAHKLFISAESIKLLREILHNENSGASSYITLRESLLTNNVTNYIETTQLVRENLSSVLITVGTDQNIWFDPISINN